MKDRLKRLKHVLNNDQLKKTNATFLIITFNPEHVYA